MAPSTLTAGDAMPHQISGVLLVDDHHLVRLGLRTLLQSHAASCGTSIEVFEARTLNDALTLYDRHQLAISLVLLDLHLPDAHGMSGLVTFLKRFPGASRQSPARIDMSHWLPAVALRALHG